jgi:hypothetical protein
LRDFAFFLCDTKQRIRPADIVRPRTLKSFSLRFQFFSAQVANQFARMTTAGRTMDQRVESVARYRRRTVCGYEKGYGFSGDFVRAQRINFREAIIFGD